VRLASYEWGGRESYGVVAGGGIVDLGRRLGSAAPDLRALLARDDGFALAREAGTAEPDVALSEVRLLPPVPRPGKIFCIGVNYLNRNEEYRDGSARPAYPSIFMRTPGSFVGHGTPLERPPESNELDYEGEIALVIGRGGRRIEASAARDHVAGLTCANEGTLRDWVRHGKFNVTQGKNFARSGALGPWLVPSDEFASFEDLHVQTRVNGEVRQDDTTASLAFSFGYLIAYVSTFCELEAGDTILTGTPTGAGARFDPPRYLVPGDRVEVEVEGIGTLENGVVDECVPAKRA